MCDCTVTPLHVFAAFVIGTGVGIFVALLFDAVAWRDPQPPPLCALCDQIEAPPRP